MRDQIEKKIEKEINKLGLDGKVMLVGQQKDMQGSIDYLS